MIGLKSNPKGNDYKQLIDFATKRAPLFILADREILVRSEHCVATFNKLGPFLVNVHSYNELYGRNEIAYSDGYFYVYRCCEESAKILAEVANSLFSWQHPNLPEDLCFLNNDGSDFMVSVAHEEIGYIQLNKVNLPNEFIRII